MSSTKDLIAIASIQQLLINQMDLKTVFLNGTLEGELYMDQTEGFVVLRIEHKICVLKESLYDLNKH